MRNRMKMYYIDTEPPLAFRNRTGAPEQSQTAQVLALLQQQSISPSSTVSDHSTFTASFHSASNHCRDKNDRLTRQDQVTSGSISQAISDQEAAYRHSSCSVDHKTLQLARFRPPTDSQRYSLCCLQPPQFGTYPASSPRTELMSQQDSKETPELATEELLLASSGSVSESSPTHRRLKRTSVSFAPYANLCKVHRLSNTLQRHLSTPVPVPVAPCAPSLHQRILRSGSQLEQQQGSLDNIEMIEDEESPAGEHELAFMNDDAHLSTMRIRRTKSISAGPESKAEVDGSTEAEHSGEPERESTGTASFLVGAEHAVQFADLDSHELEPAVLATVAHRRTQTGQGLIGPDVDMETQDDTSSYSSKFFGLNQS